MQKKEAMKSSLTAYFMVATDLQSAEAKWRVAPLHTSNYWFLKLIHSGESMIYPSNVKGAHCVVSHYEDR